MSQWLQQAIRDVDVSTVRKCGSCGYLLFGDGDTCNHCGAVVEAGEPAAPAVTRPAAATAMQVRAPEVRPPVALPIAPPPPRTFDAPPSMPWQPVPPVAVSTPTKSSAPRTLLTFVVLAVVVLGGIGIYLHMKGAVLPPGTSDFAAGRGVAYSPADNSFTARFPKAPEEQSQPITVGSISMTVDEALVQTDDYEIGVASMSLPVAVPESRVDSTLDNALDDGISSVKGDLVSKQRITRGGLPALDAKFKADDGYTAHLMVILDRQHLYLLVVHAKSGTEKLFHALDTSFVPTVLR